MPVKLLIIEDEEKTAQSLRRALAEERYQPDVAVDGLQGLEMARTGRYQLIILDLMLPHLDGLQVLDRLRTSGDRTPVLLLTAMNRVHDRVKGLQAGADDYLVKPFALAELLARVQAILRRSQTSPGVEPLEIDELSISYPTQTVTRSGQPVELTPKEFRILCVLAESPGRLVSRKDLCQKVWGLNFDCETNLVDVAIRRLRQKLDDPFPTKLVHTVRGAEYVLGHKDR